MRRGGAGSRHRFCWGRALKRLGLRECRLKTGTPPRLDGGRLTGRSLRSSRGMRIRLRFSFRSVGERVQGVSAAQDEDTAVGGGCRSCGRSLSYCDDTAETLRLIRENVHRSPMYRGRLRRSGRGIVLRLRTRLCGFRRRRGPSFFWSRRG